MIDIRRLLEAAVMDPSGWRTRYPRNRNRTLAYLAQVASGLLQAGELERRLNPLEAAIGPRLRSVGVRK